MARSTLVSFVVLSAALTFGTVALAQTSQPMAKPPSTMKKMWNDVKARQACRKEAALQKIPAQDQDQFILTCSHRLTKGDRGKDVLPKLYLSSDSEKAEFKDL